jgi:hypothetical protein
LGHGKKDRRVTNRVDHDKIDDEGGDEGFKHEAGDTLRVDATSSAD